MPRRVVSLCWYNRSDYQHAQDIMVDKERLAPSFEEWKLDAERMEEIIGVRFATRRIVLRPSEFLAWCKMVGVRTDALARDRFMNEAAA